MLHRCLSRVAAVTAACFVLFFCLPASYYASAEGNIIRAAAGGATSGSCGADWAHPCDLQYALRKVSQPGDEIWVRAGTYFPTTSPTDRTASFALRDGVNLYGGFAGIETARDQRDWQANPTILSGDIDHNDLASPAETAGQIVGGNSLHVVYAYDLYVDAYLDGFIITAGLGSGTEGGGVLLSVSGNNPPFPGMAHLSNVHIMGSRARDGGGIFFNHSGTLTDALVSGCAADQEGGGIGIHGEPTLTRVIIANNTAPNGGGMEMTWSAPILTDLVFAGNTAALYGGGLHVYYADPIISGSFFVDNISGSGGGAIYFSNARPQVTGTTFESNTTNGNGGAIYNDYSILTLRDSLMAGNSAVNGGGMYSFENAAEITNVTVTGNIASQAGGGFSLVSSLASSVQVLKHVTITNNLSNSGGGLYVTGSTTPELRNSIVWSNLGPYTTPQIGGTVSVQYSVVEGGYSGGYQIRTDDPLLGVLSDVGGSVRVQPLLPGSSAIDFSAAAYCPDTDVRGVSRPQGASCDAGAYESRGFTLAVNSGSSQSAAINQSFAKPLTVTVSSAANEPVEGGRVTFTPPASGASATVTGSPAQISGGKASVTAKANGTAGTYSITASGRGIQPVSIPLTNLPAGATILASVDKSPVVYGEPLTFRAQVQSNVGTPTGKVQFRLDGANIGDPVDLAGGAAVLNTSQFVAVGTHQLTAAYRGGSHPEAVTPQPVDVIVQPAAATVTLTSSATPALLGQSITLNAEVSVTAPGRGEPTGELIFTVDGGLEQPIPLKDGLAEMTLTELTVGEHSIEVKYAGDGTFAASPAVSFQQWVHNPVPVLSVLIPGSVREGSLGVTLTVIGTGFTPETIACWSGVDLPTIVENTTTLKVTISAALLAEPAQVMITVANPAPGGGESNAVEFRVVEGERMFLPMVLSHE